MGSEEISKLRKYVSIEAPLVSSFIVASIPPIFHKQINTAISENPGLTIGVMVAVPAVLILWAVSLRDTAAGGRCRVCKKSNCVAGTRL